MYILYLPLLAALGAIVFIGCVIYAKLPWTYAEAFFFIYSGLIIWWIEDKIEDRRLRQFAVAFHEDLSKNPIVLEGESEMARQQMKAGGLRGRS